LRDRVIGAPEISTDGWPSYGPAIRAAFQSNCSHGVIEKTYAGETAIDDAHRYSPGDVVAVSRSVAIGLPTQISTTYVERQNLSIRRRRGASRD
jgi:hypothetical protein